MKKIGLINALALTKKADKMSDHERTMLQQKRLKELISYVKVHSPYFAEIYANIDGKYLVYTTSGSTGNPCIVLYDESTVNVSAHNRLRCC